ncbi:glycosyltransferase [Opitutus terrae]|uniref:Glycosyl transferase family 2 n=1 Tax=Opitutus terrae (strain DSM 11246 / JCM 15787 / PB90-1) TaxID=452637 RepID=B1ZZR1_OPITP|nr:glycosyltransferase [Opitutus terrae]ACB77247.1 glycosyl transferase family 2 [Opitutus terrae PB90-1]
MNILFVNYGDFTSNSLNHIAAFANQLTLLGHACVVAVPENPDSISAIPQVLFTPVTFARALESEPIFPDRRGADVVHTWTPRENVREFTLAYLHRTTAAALIIHLEDNEEFLLASYAHESLEKLRELPDEELVRRLSPRLSHPVRFRNFLQIAHGVTCITDRLREFVPTAKPAHRLLPGVDPAFYRPQEPDARLRSEIGVALTDKLLVFTGSTTFANLADVRSLLLAVRLLNERGVPCKLVRTGINPPPLAQELAALGGPHVIDLGFVPKPQLGPLLALADVLVQPGTADAFNDYRLPSKIPEFMSVGRPVVIPRANLAKEMEHGRHALLLNDGSPAEIADACARIFAYPALAQRLAEGALEFARDHFDLTANTAGLLEFYKRVRARATPLFQPGDAAFSEDVLLTDGNLARRMRAKEQTIAQLRETLAAREATVAERDAAITAQQAEIAALRAKSNADLAAMRQHVANLENVIVELRRTLEDAAAQRARAELQENYHQAKLQEVRAQIEVLRAQLADASATAGFLRTELERARAQAAGTAEQIRQRDDKIARMTRSFSWQATAPLRALRRTVLDPLQRRAPGGAAPVVPIESGFVCSIDQPTDWADLPPEGSVAGWVLAPSASAVSGVRFRAGGQTVLGQHNLARPDVASGHRDHPHAGRSGFMLDYRLPPSSDQQIIFEALVEGAWRAFAFRNARCAAEVPEELRRDYAAWVRRFATLTPDQIVERQQRVEALPLAQRPLISVIMPVYNTPEKWLVKAIESVRAQIYPNWELCIADDASSASHVRPLLEDFARRDERIKLVFRDQNGHISAASNSALDLARGEFAALLDHDDELARDALYEVVQCLAAHPDADLIYSDEDKIDEAGRRFDPYFKPDFLPDLFTAQNFTSHLSVYRASLIRQAGGFRIGYEGSQDWDLALRAIDLTERSRIQHVPKVLYHWRAIPGSTALALGEKNYPMLAARKALADHFARRGETVELLRQVGDYWRVKRPVPANPPLVSLIIPTRNRADLLSRCVGSILAKTSYPRFEIIVVDNGSDEPGTLAYLDQLRSGGTTVLRYDEPFNFSAINNFAAAQAEGEILGLLNNDLEVINPDWLDEMVSHAVRPEIGCVGAMLYYPDDTIQHAGVLLGLGGVANHAYYHAPRGTCHYFNRAHLLQNYSAVTAACLLIRRKVFAQVGGLNATDLAIAFNDVDFCLRVRAAGYLNLWTPFAEFYHHESPSRGSEDTPEKLARFHAEVAYMQRTWGPLLERDPAYNPNLTLDRQDFSLAFPPRR